MEAKLFILSWFVVAVSVSVNEHDRCVTNSEVLILSMITDRHPIYTLCGGIAAWDNALDHLGETNAPWDRTRAYGTADVGQKQL